MAELRERERLTASIVRNMATIGAVDVNELEVLAKRVRAIVNDLRIIRDDVTVRELQRNE